MHRVLRLALPALALACALALGAACGPMYETKADRLDDSVRTFNENVRWQRFREAGRYVPAPRREGWVRAMERAARSLVVTEYELTTAESGDDLAVMHVDLAFYSSSDMVLRHMRRRQEWRYEGGAWVLASDREIPREEVEPGAAIPDLGDPAGGDAAGGGTADSR